MRVCVCAGVSRVKGMVALSGSCDLGCTLRDVHVALDV